jgi:hypothetical protein
VQHSSNVSEELLKDINEFRHLLLFTWCQRSDASFEKFSLALANTRQLFSPCGRQRNPLTPSIRLVDRSHYEALGDQHID